MAGSIAYPERVAVRTKVPAYAGKTHGVIRRCRPDPFSIPSAVPVLVDIAELATCPPGRPQADVGLVRDAALAWDETGRVTYAGPRADLPASLRDAPARSVHGATVVPGLVDCHTHLAFGGDRATEFTARLLGADYLAQARQGGGIAATVRATRAASEDDLVAVGRAHLDTLLAQGVTTVEAKSGYGLSLADEVKTLRAYSRLAADGPQRLVPTCLAAHVVPPEFADDREGYLRLVETEILSAVAAEGLAAFFDVFVEDTAFTPDEAWRLCATAHRLGLVPKLHADQLSDTGGAALAVEVGAASADHLECVSETGIAALASVAGTPREVVAVSLPVATLVLGVAPLPARRLLDAGVPVAVATDLNPGSAPACDLHLAAWLACTRQRMTQPEVLAGITREAAKALRRRDIGTLTPGAWADVAVLDAPSVEAWLYRFRPGTVRETLVAGRTVYRRP